MLTFFWRQELSPPVEYMNNMGCGLAAQPQVNLSLLRNNSLKFQPQLAGRDREYKD
jgi:hypothetical protein